MGASKDIVIAGFAAWAVFGTGAVALASVPSCNGTINACGSNLLWSIRVIDAEAGQRCNGVDKALNWNQ